MRIASVETTAVPTSAPSEVAQTSAATRGERRPSDRAMSRTRSAVITNASAWGRRIAHSLRPKTVTLAAMSQYVSGGLARCGSCAWRRGTHQSPLSTIWSAMST
jgi:hypothetical protein